MSSQKISDKSTYSVVVPVYNTSDVLYELVERIIKVFENEICADYEIIMVDDSSSNPKTWSTLKDIFQKNENVIITKLTRNFGQQAATICGLKLSKGDYVFTMDDDLQHFPEDFPEFIAKKEHDIVIAQFKKKRHSFFKTFTSKLKSYFDYIILGKPKDIQLSPFRMINRVTVDGILSQTNTPYPFIPAMMFYVSKDVVGVFTTHGQRLEGNSTYGFFQLLRLFTNLLINNSSLLLTFIGNIGITISISSFVLAFIYIYRRIILEKELLGWTSLMVSILFIGGLVLFSLGIIGEYLIRIIQGTENKPLFITRETMRKTSEFKKDH